MKTFRQSSDKRMARATVATPGRRLVAGNLACGHPGLLSNLKDGKCGTCWMAADFERSARESSNLKVRRIFKSLAKKCHIGEVLYDTSGKTFLEWEKTLQKP